MMKHRMLLLSLLFAVALLQGQDFTTHTYFSNDSISLDLDLFLPEQGGEQGGELAVPLLIYVHGGGFSNGYREKGHNLAKYLNSQGMACATISYTLYMKDKSYSCDGIASEKIKAIQIAASQLWHATAYMKGLGNELNIDTARIFIAGSSAGAETVLHAAYWNRDQMQLFEKKLPSSFRYAGIIAGAGAIMDLNFITEENMIPAMMFHGDADRLVPFGTAAHHHCPPDSPGWLMLFGSQSIAQHLKQMGGTCQLITFPGGGHDYAGAYFFQDQQPVADFIRRVLAEETFTEFRTIGKDDSQP